MKSNIDLTENMDFRKKRGTVGGTRNGNMIVNRLRNSYSLRFNKFNLLGYGDRDFMFFGERTLEIGNKKFVPIGEMLPINKFTIKSILEKLNTTTCVSGNNDTFSSTYRLNSTNMNGHDYGGYIDESFYSPYDDPTNISSGTMFYKYDPAKNFCIRCGAPAPMNYPWSKRLVELCEVCQADMRDDFSDSEILGTKEKVLTHRFKDL